MILPVLVLKLLSMPSMNISELIEEMHHFYIMHLAVLMQDEIKLGLTVWGLVTQGFSFYFSFWFMEHGSSSGGSGPYSSMSEEQCSFVVTPPLSSLEAKEKEDDCKLSAAEGQSVCQSPDTACFRVCALVPEEAILCARVLIQCILEVVLWSLKKQFW